jgi:hypothetical protein
VVVVINKHGDKMGISQKNIKGYFMGRSYGNIIDMKGIQ